MKKLIVLSVLCLSQAVFALQSPYLYTTDSISDTTIQLTWRNNATYLGIIILRKTSAAGLYNVIDTTAGSATSFTDIVKPPAQTMYYYALTAYSQTEHADTSNVDSASITPKPFDSIFVAPPAQQLGIWYLDTLIPTVYICFWDTSNVENGYRIYRSTNFDSFEMIKDIPSTAFFSKGNFCDTDATVSPNTWYMYYVVVYKGQQTLSSVTDTLFTFDLNAMKRENRKKCSLLDNIASFPINYGSWSLKSGDTIVLNERGAPDSVFSIIDVSNPSAPRFAGTGKSSAALALYYPSKIALYAYTKGDYLFKPQDDSLICYKYHSGTMQTLSALNIGRTVLLPYGFLSDTVLVVPNLTSTPCTGIDCLSSSYLWADNVLFKNDILSYSKEQLVYDWGCDGAFFPCDYSESPSPASGVMYQGRFFVGIPGYGGNIADFKVFDFNFPVPQKTFFGPNESNSSSLFFLDIQLLNNGITLDAPALTADSSWIRSNAHAILIDTVKNLVFALSDSELSIYNCQIVAGISHPVSSAPHSVQFLHVAKGKDDFVSLIFLPHHNQPCAISIFDVSGRRVAQMEGIQGEIVVWPHQNRTGVYIVRAIINGGAITAKVVLSK